MKRTGLRKWKTLEVVELDFDEAMDAYSRGELCDSKTVFALFYWQMRRQKMNK